jgi:hypothetical protein
MKTYVSRLACRVDYSVQRYTGETEQMADFETQVLAGTNTAGKQLSRQDFFRETVSRQLVAVQ